MRMRTLLSVFLLTAACSHNAPAPTVSSVSTVAQPQIAPSDRDPTPPLRESVSETVHAAHTTLTEDLSQGPVDLGEGRSVDPIIPSWAPLSCYQYLRNVVDALACKEIPHAARELIQSTYQQSSANLQAQHNVQAETLTAIGKQCAESAALVAVEARGKCKAQTTASR